MNLEEKIKAKTTILHHKYIIHPIDNHGLSNQDEVILATDALRIAKEYAKEMCKEQKQMCADAYLRDVEKNHSINEDLDTILRTPLATEVKDGN